MNRVRRKEIEGVIACLADIQMQIEAQAQIIADIGSDEEEYRDAIPESMQDGVRFQAAQDAADALENARSDLEAIDLADIIASLREAQA